MNPVQRGVFLFPNRYLGQDDPEILPPTDFEVQHEAVLDDGDPAPSPMPHPVPEAAVPIAVPAAEEVDQDMPQAGEPLTIGNDVQLEDN